jgi:putative ABC transport system permease protein
MAELRHDPRGWIAVAGVATASGICLHLITAFMAAGASAPSRATREAYSSIGGTVACLVAASACIALGITAALCVRLQRRNVARWQLAGLLPHQAGRVVRVELGLVTLAGAGIGIALAYGLWPAFGRLALKSLTPNTPGLHQAPSPSAITTTLAITLGVALIAGGRAAAQARQVEPIQAIQADELPGPRFGTGRVWVCAILAGTTAAALAGIGLIPAQRTLDTTAQAAAMAYAGTAILLVGLIAAAGPGLVGPVLTTWTALIPARWSLAWQLARASAKAHLNYSSAVVTPLVVAGGAVGGTYGWVAQARDTARALGQPFKGSGTPLAQMVMIFGGPVLIAAVATAAVVFATSADRVRDTALLEVAGDTGGRIIGQALCECLIYAVTAALLIEAALGVNSLALSWALDAGPVPGASLVPPPLQPLGVVAGGLALIAASTLTSQIAALRRPIPAVLSTN